MSNHWIWLSTLNQLATTFELKKEEMRKHFSRFTRMPDNQQDMRVQITDEESNWINSLCEKIRYPSCQLCHQPICGKNNTLCHCSSDNTRYQQEYQLLIRNTEEAEAKLDQLVDSPFRQSRNAYGEMITIVGATKLITGFLTLALLIPGLLLGMYVYKRGKKEEKEQNADFAADLMEKKISIFHDHQASVKIRHEKCNLLKNHSKLTVDSTGQLLLDNQHPFQLSTVPQTKPKPPKEKRSLFGNPLSHFIGVGVSMGSLLTIGMTLGLLSFIPGGLIGTLLIIGISALAGSYFAYKRYQFLQKKIAFENQSALLTAYHTDIKKITSTVKKGAKLCSRRLHSHAVIEHQLRETTQHSPPPLSTVIASPTVPPPRPSSQIYTLPALPFIYSSARPSPLHKEEETYQPIPIFV